VREGGAPKSHGVSGEGGGVCDSAGYLARSRRVAYSYLALCCYGGSVELCSTEFSSLEMIHACSFYSLKEVQGYMMLAYGVTLPVEEPGGLRKGLIWWQRGLYCGGMASVLLVLLLRVLVRVPLLKVWSLSFGIVATCFCHTWSCSRRGVFCPCSLTQRRGPRPRRWEMWCDLIRSWE
jgi:hypothetical protein